MRDIHLTVDQLVTSLVRVSNVAILDSCGIGHLGSRFMICGVDPVKTMKFDAYDDSESLNKLQNELRRGFAAIFTISYDFGAKLQGIASRLPKDDRASRTFTSRCFDSLIVHDYQSGTNYV